MKPPGRGGVRVLILVSSLLLGVGIFAPCLTVLPRYGEYSFLVRALSPEYGREQHYSLGGGIVSLFAGGQYFIGAVILVFSVIFPLWKLGVLLYSVESAEGAGLSTRSLARLEQLGRLSMLDVFVLALMVIAVKALPGGSEVTVRWGVIPFVAAVLLGMKIPGWIREIGKKGCSKKGESHE